MRKSVFLLLIVMAFFSNEFYAQLTPAQTNMKLFDDYSPDKTGTTDVSDLLQTAVDFCISNNRTLYISPGTYLVTKQIYAKVFIGLSCGTHNGTNIIVITGDAFNRPVIKLQDGAAGFQNTAIGSAMPVFHVQHDQGDSGESCLFWCQIKNIDFDLGNNPGAVAIRMPAAQDTQLSNIKVWGQNFAAGFTGIPGRNSLTFNCEVVGGRYAFYINNSLGATLNGLKCVNQSVAALYIAIWRGPAIVGLEISGCSGTAIICRNASSTNSNARYYQGHLVLTDARIELTNGDNFAFDIADRALVLRNVYVKGTNNLVKANSGNWTENIAIWGRIKTGSFLPSNINGFSAYNLIDDVKVTTQMKEFEQVADAPTNFVSRHIPNKIYAFNSPGAVSVASYGALPSASAGVNYEAIQKAINDNDIVYIPAGNYALSTPLVLKSNSVLLGDPGKRTHLRPTYTASAHGWVLTTPDIDGYAAIQDMAFDTGDKNYNGAIRWQISSGFILNVRNYLASGWNERARNNYVFRGKAGGRFFNIADHAGLYDGQLNPSPEFRKVIVEGTNNPITFYGLNLERGGNAGEVPQNPYATFTNANNIRVFGTKTETDGLVYSLSGCNNISLNHIMAHAHINPLVDSKVVGIYNNSTNVEINIVLCPISTPGLTMIDDATNDYVKRNEFLGVYRIGNFDASVFDKDTISNITTHQENLVMIYPTITKGLLYLNGNPDLVKIEVYNSNGILCMQSESAHQINLSHLNQGFYIIRLSDSSNNTYNRKILKI